jgi:hypothetical protein
VWHDLLGDPKFYALLLEIDQQLWASARERGCPYCGAPLHAAHYPRKPRGAPVDLPEGYDRRLSLCCSRDGCRRRTTPPSVRFLGRRVYLAVVLVLISAMQLGPERERKRDLRERYGVSRWTVCRWRRWWSEALEKTRFWLVHRSRLASPPDPTMLPASLLERFVGDSLRERLVALLRFLSPLTVPDS